MSVLQQAQGNSVPHPQKYAEICTSANSATTDTLETMTYCLYTLAQLRKEARSRTRDSFLILEILKQCDLLKEHLQDFVNDFLNSQNAELRPLSLEDVSAFLRAEAGETFSERKEYAQAA